jgi:hypothetical protein
MKRLLISAFTFIFVFATVNAQDEPATPISFGAKAGVNFATITGDDLGDVEGKTSFHVGVLAEIPISDVFSIQPELLYSRQGAKESYTESFSGMTFSEDLDIKLDYLLLPVMAKYYVTDGFSIEVGPQIGFLLNAEIDYEFSESGDGMSFNESGTLDIKDAVKSVDFGLNFGLGYKLDNGLNFNVRYNLGLTDGNDDPEFFDSDGAFKNSVFQIGVGYFFL